MAESTTKTAIVTAVLTGVFTVIAGIATYWLTTKEPALSYSVVGGPALTASSGAKRIFVVELRNSGRREVPQTLVQLVLKEGELTEVASEASPGVKLTEERAPHKVEIRADLLNPGDLVKVSFLASLVVSSAEPTVVVRAPGVQAIDESRTRDGLFSKGKPPEILALLASALGAFMSSFLLLSGRTSIGRRLGLPSLGSSLDQSEIGAFICGACGLYEEADSLRFGGTETSYRGIADYLRHRALRRAQNERSAYSTALRALLLTKGYSPASVHAIRAAIDAFEVAKLDDREFKELRDQAIDEGSDPIAWRARIEAYARSRSQES